MSLFCRGQFFSGQIFRYFISGLIATVVHIAVLTFLVEAVFVLPAVASALGFVIACCVNYILQHYWVFGAEGKHSVFFLRYAVVTAITFMLNIGFFYFLFHVAGFWYPVAQLMAIAMIFIINFLLNRSYTFRTNYES